MRKLIADLARGKIKRAWRNCALVAGLFIAVPWLAAIGDTWDIPHRGNYDEICAHGTLVQGLIQSVREEQDMDDDHWIVLHFVYWNDGASVSGEATSNNGMWKPGMYLPVRYLGSQAALPEVEPVDVDPTNDFWLAFLFTLFFMVPALIFIAVILIGVPLFIIKLARTTQRLSFEG